MNCPGDQSQSTFSSSKKFSSLLKFIICIWAFLNLEFFLLGGF